MEKVAKRSSARVLARYNRTLSSLLALRSGVAGSERIEGSRLPMEAPIQSSDHTGSGLQWMACPGFPRAGFFPLC
jgi:hypothetical protein